MAQAYCDGEAELKFSTRWRLIVNMLVEMVISRQVEGVLHGAIIDEPNEHQQKDPRVVYRSDFL